MRLTQNAASPDLLALFRSLEDYPLDRTLKLVIADRLDEEGFCGEALRWAARNNRRPYLQGDQRYSWCKSLLTEDFLSALPAELVFVGSPEHQPWETPLEAWAWLVEFYPVWRATIPSSMAFAR